MAIGQPAGSETPRRLPTPPTGTGATGTGATGTSGNTATPVDPNRIPLAKPATSPTTVPAAPRPLTNTLKSQDVMAPNDLATIASFIQVNLKRLVDGDADASGSARGDLIAGSAPLALDKPATVGFLTAYLNELTKQLTPLAGSKSPRVRVNVAIIIDRVLENTKAASIAAPAPTQNIVIGLMQDKSDAVALWGMKAAGAALTVPNQAPPAAVLKQVVPTVQAHKLDGPITDEAYSAVATTDLNPSKDLIATLMQLYQLRVEKYKGNECPEDPAIDRRPSALLTAQAGMWKQLSDAEKSKVMNAIGNLLQGATEQMSKSKDADLLDQLLLLVKKTADAVSIVASSSPSMAELKTNSDILRNVTNVTSAVAVAPQVVGGIRAQWPATTASTQKP